MSKNLRLGIVIGAFLVCCVYEVGTYAEETQRAVTIAILPCSDPVSVFKKFHSLATYLNRETGFDVKLVVPRDQGEFEFGHQVAQGAEDKKNPDIEKPVENGKGTHRAQG